MIISKTPFRISFAGGGTDIQDYYKLDYGSVVSSTINKYLYVTVNKRFDDDIRISYSKTEIVKSRYLFWILYKLNNPDTSLEKLGSIFNLDHATALNGIRKMIYWLRKDKIIIAAVEKHIDIPATLEAWDELFKDKY